MKPDISKWPTVDFKGKLFEVPLFGMNRMESGCRECCLGDRDECAECVARREAEDRKLVREMKSLRNGSVARLRPVEIRLWE